MSYKRTAYCDGEHPKNGRKCRAVASYRDLNNPDAHWCWKHRPRYAEPPDLEPNHAWGPKREQLYRAMKLTTAEMKPDHAKK